MSTNLSTSRDLSSRYGFKQAAAQGPREKAGYFCCSVSKTPLDFVMYTGWESGQTGKWSGMKLQILGFPSMLCLQLILIKTVI